MDKNKVSAKKSW